jgi:hypothetical protein
MTVTVDDNNNGENSGNNSDRFELVLRSQQDMTVNVGNEKERQTGELSVETDELSLTIVGPLEWLEFLESMRAIFKQLGGVK